MSNDPKGPRRPTLGASASSTSSTNGGSPLPSTSTQPHQSTSTSPSSTSSFWVSPVPENPLGEGKYIRTAAALIIGDEILNGKTLDRNSNYFARYCFEHGVELRRIEVIADKEDEIIEASRRMVREYDLVITSGGIGPTHDDITYEALANSFGQKLVHHAETLRRMDAMSRYRQWTQNQNDQQRAAAKRMALFPQNAEVLFVDKEIWVPVVRLEKKLCIFPGIPSLFQRMLNALTPFLPLPPHTERPLRIQVFTNRPESIIAPYLTNLQDRLKPHNIQVGSYPVLGQGVFVSLIGRDHGETEGEERIWLADVAREVEKEVGGRVVSEEDIAKTKGDGQSFSVMLASQSPPSPSHPPLKEREREREGEGSGLEVKAKF